LEYEAECVKTLSRSELLKAEDFGILFNIPSKIYIEKVEFFKEIFGKTEIADNIRINPGEIEKQGIVRTVYVYYNPLENSQATSIDDLVGSVFSAPSADYKIVYNTVEKDGEKYEEKIRSITAKNSNRFNLLQTIAETFECWVRFEIEHEDDGAIKLVDGKPQKKVYFKKEIGKDTGIGFIYGIDLKQISRTINSDKVISKVIV